RDPQPHRRAPEDPREPGGPLPDHQGRAPRDGPRLRRRATDRDRGGASDLTLVDHPPDEEMVITASPYGYIKRLPSDTYRLQRRGGRGLQGMETRDEDWVEHLFLARTHDYLMFFTRSGHCYWLKVHDIPQAGRAARGRPIVNLLALRPDEQIAALVPV